VNHLKPYEPGVASVNHHSWLGSHVVPARPWFWGSTKKQSMTSSYRSCHNVARTRPRWPLGPLNQAFLSSPHLEASPAMTFRACSSHTPTQVYRNLHLQYLTKSQSTPCCQSLITPGSDHPLVLEPHMALKYCQIWSPWYSRYEVVTLLVMPMRCIVVLLVALGYIYLWMPFFGKNAIWFSLVSRIPIMFKLCAYGYILLNLCLEPCSFYSGSKIHFSS
jgi:hypothetical protein